MSSFIMSKLAREMRDSPNPVKNDIYQYLKENEVTEVKIDKEKVWKFAETLTRRPLKYPTFDWPTHQPGLFDVWDFFYLANSINYCFWHPGSGSPPRPYENLGESGATAMFLSLSTLAGKKSLDDWLGRRLLELKDVREVFGDIPLAEWRVVMLNDALSRLYNEGHSSARDMFASYSEPFGEDGLVTRLGGFASFRDSTCGVRLLKRGQLFPYMMACNLDCSKAWDLAKDLTCFPDYRLPQALQSEGVMRYAPELDRKVRNGISIERDSKEELEIRLCTVLAVEMIVWELVNNLGTDDIPAVLVDTLLWKLGRHESVKKKYPQHLTVTTAY